MFRLATFLTYSTRRKMNTKGKCRLVLQLLLIVAITGCTLDARPEAEATTPAIHTTPILEAIEVDTVKVRFDRLPHKIFTSGKVVAPLQLKLTFQEAGRLERVAIKTGKLVREGQLLAMLDTTVLSLAREEILNRLDRARMERLDLSIQHDFSFEEGDSLPQNIQRMIDTESGYRQALIDQKKLNHQVRESILRAPFSGTIADAAAQRYQQVSPGEELGVLIHSATMELQVGILEQELPFIQPGLRAQVVLAAIPGESFQASVRAINPTVDKDGLVQVHLLLSGFQQGIFPGMQAEVTFEVPSAQAQIAVPVEAILKRGGRDMVFTIEDGLAKWQYVKVGARNDRWVEIIKGLSAEEYVIVSDHVGLAHDAIVRARPTHSQSHDQIHP